MYLKDIPEFNKCHHSEWLKILHSYNIRHVEQLGSYLASPEGLIALDKMGVPIEAAKKAVDPELRKMQLYLNNPFSGEEKNEPSILTHYRYPMGYQSSKTDIFRDVAFDTKPPDRFVQMNDAASGVASSSPHSGTMDSAVQYPDETAFDQLERFPADDQGIRGTCVAFSAAGMFEMMSSLSLRKRKPFRLSHQYLYYRTKSTDQSPINEEGSSLGAAMRVLKTDGCCLEKDLKYEPHHDLRQMYRIKGHRPEASEQRLIKNAEKYKIGSFREIESNPGLVDSIKRELCSNRPVGVGTAVFELAWYNTLALRNGEIALPITDQSIQPPAILDNPLGGHAIVLVGYRDNSRIPNAQSHRPGGGYFIFRNSWGKRWAWQSADHPGYGRIPYEYLMRFCLEAVVIDDLIIHERKPRKRESI